MQSKTFCVLPWYSEEINGTDKSPCCLLPKDHDLVVIKSDLLSGIQSPACQKCWTLEDQKQDSRRIQENRFLDWKLDKDIKSIEQDCITNQNQTLMYQIYLSNLCNQACVTCGSTFSTKWIEIEKKMGVVSSAAYHPDFVEFEIDFKTAQRINLLGGEPMFDPRSFHVLNKLLENNNDQCFISFVTNGSVELNDQQKNVLKAFPNLNICFSIDGIQSRFEYMRWPGKWNTLLKNLDQYQTVTDNFSISYTISAVNAIYYDETIQWFEKENMRYNHNVVYRPQWVGLPNMPVKIKQHLKDHAFFKPFTEITGKELAPENFLERLEKQNIAKKIKMSDYLPELLSIIQ